MMSIIVYLSYMREMKAQTNPSTSAQSHWNLHGLYKHCRTLLQLKWTGLHQTLRDESDKHVTSESLLVL